MTFQNLLAKSARLAGEQRVCPHYSFTEMGGGITPITGQMDDPIDRQRLGDKSIFRGSPRRTYKCDICGIMMTQKEYEKLR